MAAATTSSAWRASSTPTASSTRPLSFCTIHEMEAFDMEKAAQETGIPYMHLSTDYSSEGDGQLTTHIQAFLEMILAFAALFLLGPGSRCLSGPICVPPALFGAEASRCASRRKKRKAPLADVFLPLAACTRFTNYLYGNQTNNLTRRDGPMFVWTRHTYAVGAGAPGGGLGWQCRYRRGRNRSLTSRSSAARAFRRWGRSSPCRSSTFWRRSRAS
ncbi:2-hydroxyacyl-CoA dehydratase [Parafannyhessea umbonata]|uniref:2-hydroxyacyl-CoA dehydratase n=1 Tax=Parafannyhessea umbonata TaxID=604330 RepID=UPI00115FD7B6